MDEKNYEEPICALIEVVPLSLPIVSLTGTGLTVPVKLALDPSAWSEYCLVPVFVSAIRTCKTTPFIVP